MEELPHLGSVWEAGKGVGGGPWVILLGCVQGQRAGAARAVAHRALEFPRHLWAGPPQRGVQVVLT